MTFSNKSLRVVSASLAVLTVGFSVFTNLSEAQALSCSETGVKTTQQYWSPTNTTCSGASGYYNTLYSCKSTDNPKARAVNCTVCVGPSCYTKVTISSCSLTWTCPDSGWTGSAWCSGKDLYQKYRTYSCGDATDQDVAGGASQTSFAITGPCNYSDSTLVKTANACGYCGTANGGTYTSFPTTAESCVGGSRINTSTTATTYSWQCSGNGQVVSCSANRRQNGACGSADGQSFPTKPTTNLCSIGSASAVAGTGPWSWTCAGINGGTTASCSANVSYINGGMKARIGGVTVNLALEPAGTLTSPLRIRKGGVTYGIVLVSTTDPKASPIRIKTAGGIKAIREY